MHNERRVSDQRDRCAIPASISTGIGSADIPCVVENLSERGARLRFESETFIPPKINVLMPLFEGQTYPRAAEVCWRVGAAIGVRFVG